MARWLADYPEWLQFCWDFVKPPRNDEIALKHFFFLLVAVQEFFFLFHLCCMQFFLPTSASRNFFSKSPTPPPPTPSRVNGWPQRCAKFPTSSFLLACAYHWMRCNVHLSEEIVGIWSRAQPQAPRKKGQSLGEYPLHLLYK